MATVRQRASGSWQVIVQVRQPNGQRRQESRTFPTEAEARTYAHKLEYDVRSGDMPADRATVLQLCIDWLAVQRHAKPSTYSAQRHALRIAWQALGNTQARRLTANECEKAWAQLLDRYSYRYVKQARSTLATVFDWAALDGRVATNPVRTSKVRAQKLRAELTEDAVFTAGELRALLAFDDPVGNKKRRTKDFNWAVMWRLLADTGLRQGEARALRWRDINLDTMTLAVRATRTRTRTKDGRSTEEDGVPKSAQSRRTVPLTTAARDALVAHRSDVASRHGLDLVQPGSYVFPGPRTEAQLTSAWKRARQATGIRESLTPHSLRHTFASALLAEGVALTRVAALCGHTVNVCARTYAHWIGDVDHGAIEILERSRQLRAVD